jgi:hypothetical protein
MSSRSPQPLLLSRSRRLSSTLPGVPPYIEEALSCYQHGLYRAPILMVWAAIIQHLYSVAGSHRGGIAAFESATRPVRSITNYREIKKQDDFLYLGERDFVQLGEDAVMFNRHARRLLQERLDLRNLCGHPTQYRPGREETVIFIESRCLNVLSGSLAELELGGIGTLDLAFC